MTNDTTPTIAFAGPERRTPSDAIPFGAFAAIGGAVVLSIVNGLANWMLAGQTYETTGDLLNIIDRHRTLALAADGLGFVAALLLVPGIWAVAHRLRERSAIIAGAGGWLAASGYVAFMVLVVEGQVALSVATAGGDPSTFIDAADNHTSVVQLMIYVVFGVGALLGPAVLGVAMLRQRDSYPVWAGAMLIASPVARMGGLMLGLHFLPSVASLMLGAGFAAVMLRRR